jgi:hypothetical protein
LALRYTAASDKTLRQESGVLGLTSLVEGQDLTAVGVKNATLKVLTDLCVADYAIPYSVSWLVLALETCLNHINYY